MFFLLQVIRGACNPNLNVAIMHEQCKSSYSLRQKQLGHFNQTLFFPSHAPLVPLEVVHGGLVTKSCTPTLRGKGDPKVSQPF